MFDYQYASSTQKIKYKIKDMLPRVHISQSPFTRVLSLIMRFLPCFEVIDLSILSKKWYSATWDATLWREMSKSLGEDSVISSIFSTIDQKVKTFEASVQKQVGDVETFQKLADCIRWKLVCITYIYRYCSHCMASDGKLRFLPVLKKTLCFNCSKDPEFAMISLENAESEYAVVKEDIQARQLEGLRVPHTNNSGKFMFVYYLKDILSTNQLKNLQNKHQVRTCIEERRRTEIVWYMRELNVPLDFIESYLSTEGTLAHNYMMGRSRMTADKVSKALAKIFFCEKRKEDKKVEETLSESPKVVKKIKLTEDDKIVRKMQLIERLTLMGLDTEKIDFEDKSGLAYSYIIGRTSKELGVVAGTIWREYKPIFTGVTSKTTQRIKDLIIMMPDMNKKILAPLVLVASAVFVLVPPKFWTGSYQRVETRNWSSHYFDEKIVVPKKEKKGHFH